MTTPIIRAMLVATLVFGSHAVAFGQTIVDFDTYRSDIQLKNVLAVNDRLFVWERGGVRLFDAGKLSPKTHFNATTSPNGRAFAVDQREGDLQIIELIGNKIERIYQHKIDDLSNCVLITNESGSRIWCILLSKAGQSILVLDTKNRLLVEELNLSSEFSDETNVYAASGRNLFVATITLKGAEVAYDIRTMTESGNLSEPLTNFKNTVLFRLESCEDGSLVAAGRNELHQPSSGFVCNLDIKTFNARWTNRELMPYCLPLAESILSSAKEIMNFMF